MNKKAEAGEWVQKGNILLRQNKQEEAKRMYIRALQLDPNNAQTYHYIGLTYFVKNDRTHSTEDYNKSAQALTKATILNSGLPGVYRDLGMALAKQKRYKEACENFSRAIIDSPNDHLAYDYFGQADSSQRNYDAAIHKFMEAIELNPNYAPTYFHLGLALMNKKQFNRALVTFQKAIELNPNLTEAHSFISSILRILKRPSEAKEFERQNRHVLIEIWHKFADDLLNKNDLFRAERACKCIIEFDSNNGEAYRKFGIIYSRHQNWKRAAINYSKAINLLPPSLDMYLCIGKALSKKGKQSEALRYYVKGTLHFPRSAELYNDWGLAYYDIKAYKEAIIKFEQAIEIDPGYSKAYRNLGETLKCCNEFARAQLCLKKAYDLDPRMMSKHIKPKNFRIVDSLLLFLLGVFLSQFFLS